MEISEIREIVSSLAREYGAQRIYLFGSYTRGEETAQSDVDLRIDKGQIRGVELGGLLLDLEEALGLHVNLVTTGSLTPKFLSSIAKNEILLYEAQQKHR